MLLTDAHAARGLPLEAVAALVALNPASRFRLPQKGRLEVGADADFALVRLEERWTLETLHDRWAQNPYRGQRFQGRVEATYLRGQPVYAGGQFSPDVRGRLLRPQLG